MSTTVPVNSLIRLTVARVERGGNAGGGQYFFSFDPDPLLVVDAETMMTFALSEDTAPDIKIHHFVSSDALAQLGKPEISADRRRVTVVNRNSVAYLLQVALVVFDEKKLLNLICDPQVINSPRSGGG